MKSILKTLAMAAIAALTASAVHAAEPRSVMGATCNNPPRISCGNANCLAELSGNQGPAVELVGDGVIVTVHAVADAVERDGVDDAVWG